MRRSLWAAFQAGAPSLARPPRTKARPPRTEARPPRTKARPPRTQARPPRTQARSPRNLAHSYSEMSQQQSYSWEEDDFQLPPGVKKIGREQPNCGQTYVMYHGTTRTIAKDIQRDGFKQSADGMLGCGVYLSRDMNKARAYPIDPKLLDSERVVFRVNVNVGNVIKINYQGHPRQKNWHDSRYDTAWCPPNCGMTRSGMEEDCVWDPNRIKIDKWITPTPMAGENAQPSIQ
uniref:PARP catalytic domain-containing protein n=1 Tax=Gadus morhua TaxID=8049 RepID=A0A8C5FAD4_GADMO